MKLTVIAGYTGFLLAIPALASISDSCKSLKLTSNDAGAHVWFTANCSGLREWSCSIIDLDLCYGWVIGSQTNTATIVAEAFGNFGTNCTTCKQEVLHDPAIVTCNCLAYYDGEVGSIYEDTQFSLDAALENADGFLQCFEQQGRFQSFC
ncbi:hypothetical protein M406DRAFT_327715 [Cryphonectria parasitica EP155]|uniref:Cyanovirin-N domain-containing protein n=1 Tax=Cryphonectria parasitica (strain ATCC 38755 / EP155) TaxID=660469 RepID=A0A9P4YB01_CRYP1|nr:uncharacterized protein M406DRAFT_327715 [Cryphonectria parasitica EP155]KAF3769335.1 hypothetical protein M406DRAFT_327715 [Cryphonectria parasitica EP155]